MKSATQEVLFQIVCTVIFVLASILMITEFVSAQSIVKQYGKQMGIHNELQLQDGDSKYCHATRIFSFMSQEMKYHMM